MISTTPEVREVCACIEVVALPVRRKEAGAPFLSLDRGQPGHPRLFGAAGSDENRGAARIGAMPRARTVTEGCG
jgi:hypothetical protein